MQWWFGRKAAPEPVRAIVPAWLSASEGQGFVRSYEAQFDEVYRNNPVGQRAVRLVSGLLGSLSIYAAEGDERAAALVSGDGLVEAIGAALLLHGNAYVQLLTDEDEKPAELILLRPERVSVVTDDRGWPVAYRYRAAGRTTRLARTDGLGRAQVAHIRSLHPLDDHYGMGCLDAAAQLQRVDVSSSHVGAIVRVTPLGLADLAAEAVELVVSGEAMRPPSPVHLRAFVDADGTLRCTWIRRSRRGWAWLDGVDAPLGCSTELYRVRLQSGGSAIDVETSVTEAQFRAADLAAFAGGDADLSVVQVGDLPISRAASLTIKLS